MIAKILTSSIDKPYSNLSERIRKAYTNKKEIRKHIKPKVVVEESRRLPVPVIVSYSRQKSPIVQELTSIRSRWRSRKQQYEPKTQRFFGFWKRDSRRKALKPLSENKKQKGVENKKERINDIILREQAKQLKPIEEKKTDISLKVVNYEPNSPRKKKQYEPVYWSMVENKKKDKKTNIHKKSTYCGTLTKKQPPRSVTKNVSEKKYVSKDSISNRFVNFCYRICCQFYCCITCILLVTFVVIAIF